jgi:hypothetical protein
MPGAACLSPWTSSPDPPPSPSTLPLAMPHSTSPAHRPDPELLPIHPPRLANSRSSPKTALAYTIPAYAFSLSD